jgi:hypothetical protein
MMLIEVLIDTLALVLYSRASPSVHHVSVEEPSLGHREGLSSVKILRKAPR